MRREELIHQPRSTKRESRRRQHRSLNLVPQHCTPTSTRSFVSATPRPTLRPEPSQAQIPPPLEPNRTRQWKGWKGKKIQAAKADNLYTDKLHIGGGDGAVARRLPLVVPFGACLPDREPWVRIPPPTKRRSCPVFSKQGAKYQAGHYRPSGIAPLGC
jgi:hypothetical protein